jgi:hypothetical protein
VADEESRAVGGHRPTPQSRSRRPLCLLIGVGLAWTRLPTDSRVIGAMLWWLVVEVVTVAGFVGVQVVASWAGRADCF